MDPEYAVPSLAIDLTRLHRRTVTSFYSNLVTRPTGRAVRMGLEGQLMELDGGVGVRLSLLDFSQVRVLDYSCADEIVAKLLLRYSGGDRPADAYFVARGLQDHHRVAIEAVLERHDLRLVAQADGGPADLLGCGDPVEARCWAALAKFGRATADMIADDVGLGRDAAVSTLGLLARHRVAIPLANATFCAVSALVSAP
jgi:hypothetical protein